MGVGSSKRRVRVETPGMLDTYSKDSALLDKIDYARDDTLTIESFKTALEVVVEYHKSIMKVFSDISNAVGSTGKKVITLEESHINQANDSSTAFLLYLKENFGKEGNEDKVELLYDINAVHENYIPSSNNPIEREMMIFPDFEIGYKRFIDLLERILLVEEIEIGLNKEVISTQELKKKYDEAGVVINRFLTRIMFLNYAIAYNDYLSLAYTMFAARLFRDLDVMYIIAKKRSEFMDVIEQLQDELKNNFPTLIDERQRMNKATEDRSQALATAFNTEFDALEEKEKAQTMRGGNPLADVPVPHSDSIKIGELIEQHTEKLNLYKRSNILLERYFGLINSTLQSKFNELKETFEKTQANNVVISRNLTDALNKVLVEINRVDSEPYVNMKKWGKENRWSKTISPAWKNTISKILVDHNVSFANEAENEQFYNWISDGIFMSEFSKMDSYMQTVATNAADRLGRERHQQGIHLEPVPGSQASEFPDTQSELSDISTRSTPTMPSPQMQSPRQRMTDQQMQQQGRFNAAYDQGQEGGARRRRSTKKLS